MSPPRPDTATRPAARQALRVAAAAALAGVLGLLAGCRSGYDFELPPPGGRETLAQVLPVSVADAERQLLPLHDEHGRVVGALARYGAGARIELVRPGSPAALALWIERRILPRLSGYPQRQQDHGSSGWRAEGRDGAARLLAWQRHDWLFLIEADEPASFDALVSGFPYIRRR